MREGYDLWFNRDELNMRAPEQAPVVARSDGVAFLGPRDGDHGGTWMVANEFGLTICLLNDYGASWRPAAGTARFSRGRVVLASAAAPDHADLIEIVHRQPLDRTPVFYLVALSPEEGAMVLGWDGTTLTRHTRSETCPPLTSSSYATADVIATRVRRFGELVGPGESTRAGALFAYHRQQDEADGAYSVLMCRPDAATRSITHIAVRPGEVTMHYKAVRWSSPPQPNFLAPVVQTLTRRPPTTRAA